MKRIALVAALLVVAAAVIWFATGGVERSAQARIETALVEQGLPQPFAACMADRLATRLSVSQLRELEGAFAREDRARTVSEMLESARGIEDRAIVETAAASAAICAFGSG